MGIPSIEPSEVGLTGLLWLFLSYGYVLYYASNLIGEGSELLLLVPSLAGLVGGVVLPLLGAVPDGAIILFSGLGSIDQAQETLSVGVGALAGSTIMLLTVPLALSVWAGRVDLNEDTQQANYLGKPKVSPKANLCESISTTGVAITDAVQHGSRIMMITTIPYFLIQGPALFLHGATEEVAKDEHWWAFSAFLICLIGLFFYMRLQLSISKEGEDRGKRMAVTKKLLKEGRISLSGAIASQLRKQEGSAGIGGSEKSYQSIGNGSRYPTPEVKEYLEGIVSDAFYFYDTDKNAMLDRHETYTFFRDFHESISEKEMEELFNLYDTDRSGSISLDEFIGLVYTIIKTQDAKTKGESQMVQANTAIAESAFADVEEEEIPEDITHLTPEEQQRVIKGRAFTMLAIGTLLVVIFSDPMVDVMQEIAVRANLSPFYVSFILAPLASNASEVLSSQYYAAKKTSKTITVSMSALSGAASMNNTFCLSIFMGLIFFRGLAWQYTAETTAILIVEFIVGILMQTKSLSTQKAFLIGSIFPLSIALVATMESFGLD